MVREGPVLLHWLDHGQVVGLPQVEIVLAEGGGYVNDTGPVLHGDEIGGRNEMGGLVRPCIRVERLVPEPFQIGAHHPLEDLVLPFLQQDTDPLLREDELVSLVSYPKIRFVGGYCQCNVRYERPGRCCPGKDIGVLLVLHLEPDEYGWVLDLFVPLGHLVR